MSAREPVTPCIAVCTMDPKSGLCLGCGRTLAEIARWGDMEPPERRAIMAELPARMAGAGLPPPPPPRRAGKRDPDPT